MGRGHHVVSLSQLGVQPAIRSCIALQIVGSVVVLPHAIPAHLHSSLLACILLSSLPKSLCSQSRALFYSQRIWTLGCCHIYLSTGRK